MKVYFDTEFTGLRKDTSLISIGLIAENGEQFYAEFTDYDLTMCDDWIKENVIGNTMLANEEINFQNDEDLTVMFSTKELVGQKLNDWFIAMEEPVELISDVSHYDMVLLIDLFGSAFDMPENVCPVCHDINQDIARCLNISDSEAFDINREIFCKMLHPTWDMDETKKHNALHDAEVIKLISEVISFK